MSASRVRFGFVLGLAMFAGACARDRAVPRPPLQELLQQIPAHATWQSLSDEQRRQLEAHAALVVGRARRDWGRDGLADKERALLNERTPAMRENIDRVLNVTFAADLLGGFTFDRDVVHAELQRALIGVYLIRMNDRAYHLFDHPEFRGWDGLKMVDVPILDHAQRKDLAAYATAIEARLRSINENSLSPTERALRAKAVFTTRAVKHLAEPPVGPAGSFELAAMYGWSPERRPYTDDHALLEAFNASMFATVRDVNRGTLQSFMLNYESEFDKTILEEYGLPPGLVASVLKLGTLYRTRVFAHPDRDRRCTIYSPAERGALWDAFTATQISNANGQESLASYAAAFSKVAKSRLPAIRQLAVDVVDRSFPKGSRLLTDVQRAEVKARIAGETRPAAMLTTLYAALDQATGSGAASDALKAAVKDQPTVGGYEAGEPLRQKDVVAIDEMWRKARTYILERYSGYDVDLAQLIPVRATISTVSETAFVLGGEVNVGLKTAFNKASLYSTILHEMKHAIDSKSGRAVEGAAVEGGATSVERQVWPRFIKEAMASEAAHLPLSLLITAIDDVRLTATTDATLQRYLRSSCAADEPDTVEFVKHIVASYGYSDPDVLSLRSQRAHDHTQYLEYEYGLVSYMETMRFLEHGLGGNVNVDGFLLQACGLPSATKSLAHIEKLAACVKNRRVGRR